MSNPKKDMSDQVSTSKDKSELHHTDDQVDNNTPGSRFSTLVKSTNLNLNDCRIPDQCIKDDHLTIHPHPDRTSKILDENLEDRSP